MGSVSVSSDVVVCVLCVSCSSPQCCVLHDFQFVNASRGSKRRQYGRGIVQSRWHDCLIGSIECLLLFTLSCCGEYLYHICRSLCACSEML